MIYPILQFLALIFAIYASFKAAIVVAFMTTLFYELLQDLFVRNRN